MVESARFFRKTSDEAPLRRGGGMKYAPLALPRRRLLFIILALGCLFLLTGSSNQDYEAHYNRGVALRQQGKTEEAIKEYREAILLKPDYAKAHNSLGVALLFGRGKNAEEIAEYSENVRFYFEAIEKPGIQGVADGNPGEIEDAIEEFREAIRLKPDYAEAHTNLGVSLCGQGKTKEEFTKEFPEAIKEYREAIRDKPGYAKPHFYLGCLLGMQGKTDEELAELRKAIRLKPDYALALIELATILDQKGQGKEARGYWERASKAWPYKEGFDNGTAEWIKRHLGEPR